VAQFNWSPSIGDPTVAGWITVALYLAASLSCWRTARLPAEQTQKSREHYLWRSLSVLFLALGINKQLDLQSALTEISRIVAMSQGWYERRQAVQVEFVAIVAIVAVAAVIVLLVWTRRSPAATWLALTGAALVFGFVVIRAASFHHIDRFIGQRVLMLRWNWIVEMGGIILVIAGSEWRRRIERRT
jgi:hypothetical protein